MFGTTEKDSDLFHEIPTVIVDEVPYIEDGRGRRAAVIGGPTPSTFPSTEWRCSRARRTAGTS